MGKAFAKTLKPPPRPPTPPARAPFSRDRWRLAAPSAPSRRRVLPPPARGDSEAGRRPLCRCQGRFLLHVPRLAIADLDGGSPVADIAARAGLVPAQAVAFGPPATACVRIFAPPGPLALGTASVGIGRHACRCAAPTSSCGPIAVCGQGGIRRLMAEPMAGAGYAETASKMSKEDKQASTLGIPSSHKGNAALSDFLQAPAVDDPHRRATASKSSPGPLATSSCARLTTAGRRNSRSTSSQTPTRALSGATVCAP